MDKKITQSNARAAIAGLRIAIPKRKRKRFGMPESKSDTTPAIRTTILRLSDGALRAALKQAEDAIPSDYWSERLREIKAEMKKRAI